MLRAFVVPIALALTSTTAQSPVNSGDMKWGPGPAGLPRGTKMVFLYGDSSRPGLYIMRLRLPPNYAVPPHWHPNDENVTVLSGRLSMAIGDKMIRTRAMAIRTGGYMRMPAGTHHYVFTQSGALLQLTGDGPSGIDYVNPADDPRNHK